MNESNGSTPSSPTVSKKEKRKVSKMGQATITFDPLIHHAEQGRRIKKRIVLKERDD